MFDDHNTDMYFGYDLGIALARLKKSKSWQNLA